MPQRIPSPPNSLCIDVHVGVGVITAVATLIIPDRESAQDPALADIIRRAEAVHRRRRSGQLYPFWKGTPVEDAINAAIAAGKPVALLDREEVPEIQKHLVWAGKGST